MIPRHKPVNGHLTLHDETQNKQISSNRIIGENSFGRRCTNWNILSSKYRWAEECYGNIFRTCISLTNLHIKWHPLRAADLDRHNQVKNQKTVKEGVRKRNIVRSAAICLSGCLHMITLSAPAADGLRWWLPWWPPRYLCPS